MANHELPPIVSGAEALHATAWFCLVASAILGAAGLLGLIGGAW